MTLPQTIIGVDVAKNWIDAYHLATAKAERITTPKQSLAQFAKGAKGCLVVQEASGGDDRPLIGALTRFKADFSRATPGNMPARPESWPKPAGSTRKCWRGWAGRWSCNQPRPPRPNG